MKKNLITFCFLLLLFVPFGTKAHLIAPRNASEKTTVIPASRISSPKGLTKVLENTVDGTTLYGNLIFAQSWGNDSSPMGIYKFNTTDNPKAELVYRPEAGPIGANGGATLVDAKYFYCITYTKLSGTTISNELICYDIESWTEVSRKAIPLTTISTDMTWNPADQKVYGAFYNTTKNGYVFGTLDLETGAVNKLSDITLQDDKGYPAGFVVIAANSIGEVYGISQMGDLYKFNTEDGSYSLIGATGYTPLYQQSGCFDFTTKQLYWAACNENSSGIYQVNTDTGEATLLGSFNDLEEFVGLYSLSPNADLEGPGNVTDIDIAFEGAALSGTITFKLPTTTVSGNKLSGDINYTVEIDDETLSSGTSTAGSLVELPITLSEGNHTLGITTHTIHGTGPAYKASFYVGTDTPATVTGITVNREGDNVTIAWEAVTKGQHGGYVDISLLTYNVIRKPDNKIIATRTTETTVTDTELPLILGEYTYEIIVSDGTRQSDPALSDGIMLGSYLEPPYNHSFKSMDSFDQYTIINVNEDDRAWTATVNGAQLNYSRTLAADDWIVSPAMKLKAGFLYTLILKGRSSSATYKERFEVKYGTEATADALTNVIIEPNFFTTSKEETFQAVFSPQSDGTYYIGIHGISDKYMGSLYIYSIEITEPINALAPAATDEMNAVAAPEGALGATISATAPSKRADGSNLTTIAKAEIWNKTKERLVGSIDNPQPGSEVSITDTQAANGFNTYSIAFFNEAGKGYETECNAYIGIDIPTAVINPHVVQAGDKAVLTWEAPVTGINGGYIDPEKLTYQISQLQPMSVSTATEITGLTYTDESLNADSGQMLLSYQISAKSIAGEGEATPTNSILFGTPYPAPFTESWPEGKTENDPWAIDIVEKGYGDWSVTQTSFSTILGAQDGDDGWISFSGPGSYRLVSPKINVATLENPVLKIWVNNPDGLSEIHIQASVDLGTNWTTLLEINSADNNIWKCHAIDLSNYRNADFLQIGILGATEDWGAESVMIDNLRIFDQLANDLVLNGFTGPESVIGAKPADYSVKIYNDGTNEATDYKVCIYSGDKLIAEQNGKPIRSDAYETFDFVLSSPVNSTVFDLTAKIEFDGDLDTDNNSAALSVAVERPKYPTIDNLSAEDNDNSVALTWSRPALSCIPDPATDDIESYEEWSIGGIDDSNRTGTIGDYTVYDNDGQTTAKINAWAPQYPNNEAKMAFQVMSTNSESLSQQLTFYGLTAHSGKQLFACWSTMGGAANDDYLILPELKDGNRSISFWARSIPFMYGGEGYDKFEIVYSTGNNDIDNFVILEGSETIVPDGLERDPENGYNKYSFELPDNAKYVAIHCISSGKIGLLIDDIEFIAANMPDETLILNGYNLYRNGELYKQLPATEGYTDTEIEKGNIYTYNVTAVFDKGESPYSNTVTVDRSQSGIDETSGNPIKVYAAGHTIVIENVDNRQAEIFKIDGSKIFDEIISYKDRIRVETGIYIVRIDGKSFKVIVR